MDLLERHALMTPPQAGAPLVFAFHGTGGDENQFADLVPALVPGAGLVAPRGSVSEFGANRFFRRKAEGVYDMEDLSRRTAAMIDFARVRRAAHPDAPAYAFGYSNGANILTAMSLAAPDLFERIALLHPLIPWRPEDQPDLAGKRVLITGGRRDPIAPLASTEALADYFRAQRADLTLALHPGGHEIRPEEITALRGLFGMAA
jgi:phospholipase/carboxylesterase